MSMADIPGIAHTPSSGHQGTPAHAEMEPEGTLPLTPGGGGVCELALSRVDGSGLSVGIAGRTGSGLTRSVWLPQDWFG
jgi:hypothetical protein